MGCSQLTKIPGSLLDGLDRTPNVCSFIEQAHVYGLLLHLRTSCCRRAVFTHLLPLPCLNDLQLKGECEVEAGLAEEA